MIDYENLKENIDFIFNNTNHMANFINEISIDFRLRNIILGLEYGKIKINQSNALYFTDVNFNNYAMNDFYIEIDTSQSIIANIYFNNGNTTIFSSLGSYGSTIQSSFLFINDRINLYRDYNNITIMIDHIDANTHLKSIGEDPIENILSITEKEFATLKLML